MFGKKKQPKRIEFQEPVDEEIFEDEEEPEEEEEKEVPTPSERLRQKPQTTQQTPQQDPKKKITEQEVFALAMYHLERASYYFNLLYR